MKALLLTVLVALTARPAPAAITGLAEANVPSTMPCPGVADCGAALRAIRLDLARCEANDLPVMAPTMANQRADPAQAADVCADGAYEVDSISHQAWARPFSAAIQDCVAAMEGRRAAFAEKSKGNAASAHRKFSAAAAAAARCDDILDREAAAIGL
jgi:hypothetical protein